MDKNIIKDLKNFIFGNGLKTTRKSETYKYGLDENTGRAIITIQSGRYKGVSLYYGKVTLPDEAPTRQESKFRLSFEYVVTNNPTQYETDGNQDFINTIGAILSDIIWYELEDPKKGLVEAMVPLLQGTYKKTPRTIPEK